MGHARWLEGLTLERPKRARDHIIRQATDEGFDPAIGETTVVAAYPASLDVDDTPSRADHLSALDPEGAFEGSLRPVVRALMAASLSPIVAAGGLGFTGHLSPTPEPGGPPAGHHPGVPIRPHSEVERH